MRALIFLIFLPLLAPAQESTASASISSFIIASPQLKGERKVWVYLPYNYKSTKKKYPVIYMHDAQNLFDRATSFAGEWRVDETLDSLKAEVIVIGIEHGNDKRIEELTPYRNEKYGGGSADAYLDFIVNTLKPYVDKIYRTHKERKHTSIFGSSLGGLVSYYALLKYPDVFTGAGVFSPSFWFTGDIFALTENIPEINGRIYLLAGSDESEEMVPGLDRMEKLLQQKIKSPKQVYQKIVPGGKHNEALWAKEFANAFLWLAR